jgi:hypothetical protein
MFLTGEAEARGRGRGRPAGWVSAGGPLGSGLGHHRASLGGGRSPGPVLGVRYRGPRLPLLAVAQGGDRRSSGPFEGRF